MRKEIFAYNLKSFLTEYKIRNEDFQILLGVSYDRMSHWLRGDAFPKMEMMVTICDFFGYFDMYRMINEKIPVKEIKKYARRTQQQEQAA